MTDTGQCAHAKPSKVASAGLALAVRSSLPFVAGGTGQRLITTDSANIITERMVHEGQR